MQCVRGGFAHTPRWQEVPSIKTGRTLPYGRRMAPHRVPVPLCGSEERAHRPRRMRREWGVPRTRRNRLQNKFFQLFLVALHPPHSYTHRVRSALTVAGNDSYVILIKKSFFFWWSPATGHFPGGGYGVEPPGGRRLGQDTPTCEGRTAAAWGPSHPAFGGVHRACRGTPPTSKRGDSAASTRTAPPPPPPPRRPRRPRTGGSPPPRSPPARGTTHRGQHHPPRPPPMAYPIDRARITAVHIALPPISAE